MCIVIVLVCPFATIVQVSSFEPKSFGTLMAKTPHCRPARKCVGCPRVRTARLDAVVRADGNVELLLRVAVEVADQQALAPVRVVEPAFERARHARAAFADGVRQAATARASCPDPAALRSVSTPPASAAATEA